MTPIFLDYHSTSPVDARVMAAMVPFFSERFGNPASRQHAYGWDAEEAIELARCHVAALIGASPKEIVFTSGATESNNLAIKGWMWSEQKKRKHIITSPTEHESVLGPIKYLEKSGFSVTYLRVGSDGSPDLDQLSGAITSNTSLVSLMLANHEIGTISPVDHIGRICRDVDVIFHVDAAQGVGKIRFDVKKESCDLASFSAHKICGPKGVGALYVRQRRPPLKLEPLFHGGGQERGLRSGTPPVASIVGFGEAARIAISEMEAESRRVIDLRDRLALFLRGSMPNLRINGSLENRLPGNLNVSIPLVSESDVIKRLGERGIAVSSGSACSSGRIGPSYVLRSIDPQFPESLATIRFGLGRFTTEEEVTHAARAMIALAEEEGL